MWLIKHEVAEEMRRAIKAGLAPTAAQRAEFIQRREAEAAAGEPRILQRAGDTVVISVEGVLTERPDFWAWLLGGGNTTYRDIRTSLAIAGQDPAIKRVDMNMSSPGGRVDGMFETIAALEVFSKPITVRAAQADSAAFGLAAAAGGRIEAVNAASEFGSIGVAVTYFVDEDLVDITSSEAPNKRPNPATEEGQAVIREHLDALHDLFVDAIARGRSRALGEKLTKETVNETFGRGGVLLAGEAKKRRMIDKAPPRSSAARAEETAVPVADGEPQQAGSARLGDLITGYQELVTTGLATRDRAATPTDEAASRGVQQRKRTMTKEELKAQHPELYTAVLEEGQASGVAQERKRCLAHLKLGDSSGAQKVARGAIASGVSTLDEEVHAEYMSANMNRRDSDNRQADSDAAGKAVDAAKPTAKSEGGSLLDMFAADLPPAKKAS